MASLVMNEELKGIELYFDGKPDARIRNNLKDNGFRWSGYKKCWYARQSEKTLTAAKEVINDNIVIDDTNNPSKNISLWDVTRWKEIKVNSKQSTKEIAKEIRQHVRKRFSMCKFSVTSSHSSISFYIKSSPFEKDSVYLKAITEYCDSLIKQYQYCTCYDLYDDYGSSYNFYGAYAKVDYDYIQIEQTEEIKADILDFDNKKAAFNKAEEERKEKEYQEYQKQQKQKEIEYQAMIKREEEQKEIINKSIDIVTLEESKQYFVIGSQFAKINKNSTLNEYIEEVVKGDYDIENVKITKEIHFNHEKSLTYFSNMLLHDFDFLEQTGGSYTDDNRINSMTDWYNMDKEERKMVEWNLYGVAIYCNNELQFIVDAQGYSYARYVGLVDNITIQKDYSINQVLDGGKLQELKEKAETLTDLSVEVITDNNLINTWDSDNWVEYKELMKQKLKKYNIRLSKAIIQQLTENEEKLKVAMYKLLIEVDGIQEQFREADLQQGQKITMFYISDFGGIVTSQATFDKVEYTSYAQYENAVKVTFKPKNKRKLYYNYWHGTLLVYNEWLDLPITVLHDVKVENGMTVTKTKYTSCDKKQYDEILNYFESQGMKPIINTYKPSF